MEVAKRYLDEKCPDRACPMCGSKSFDIGDGVGYLPSSLTTPGPVLPVLIMFCNGCGYVAHFIANKMGLPDITGDS